MNLPKIPVDAVRILFNATGVQQVLTLYMTADTYPLPTGYYPCEKPRSLDLDFRR
jgi:hypothetical protein